MASNVPSPLPRIVQLANTISESVTKMQAALSAKGIPSPTFDEGYKLDLPLELTHDHDAVLDATAELHDLMLEPLNLIHRHGGHNNSLCLQAIAEFNMADMVPPDGQVSFGEIASQTPLTEGMTARLLRHAMTMRVFREPVPGMVAHTAASRTLHRSAANDWLQAGTKEMWPAAVKMVDALREWPASEEPNETGYFLSNDRSGTIYEAFAQDTARAERWAKGMAVFSERPQFSLSYVTDYYDWAALGPEAQVVDVGGSQGHVSMALATRFPNLRTVVQDMESVVDKATAAADQQEEELRLGDRCSFMAHDLFAPQPVKGADVYFLRWVLHNWSDKYCLLILRALVPALRPGARVLIQESLMPEPGAIAIWKEKNLRATDLNMAAAFNSQERTVAEFESLMRQADPGFDLRRVIEPVGSALGMLEFVWQGSAEEDGGPGEKNVQ
ncbi:O-methyltransferase [Apiospora marii]|uniref:O-methyltransferase n=1 Tax=Apiospora marii TaxID=335849 RepID=A0ABR1RQ99_9PEZI